MTKQLSLFPDSSLNLTDSLLDEKMATLVTMVNPVDEIFAASTRFRNSRNLMELLDFIARFPNYSPFNGLLLYIQNASATYVATARNWLQKFKRQPKYDARPMAILAPMAPILFVFDIHDTEGAPVPSAAFKAPEIRNQIPAKVYMNTLYNCATHGIAVHETTAEKAPTDTASRITPALRKQFKNFDFKKDTSYLILIDKAQSLEDKYLSLVHEMGHIFCGHLGVDRHAWWPEREDAYIDGEEIEADAVAYLVCKRLGLQARSAKYLPRCSQIDLQLPVFSLNAVLQAVSYIEEMGKFRWKEPRKQRRS
jgi:hypothetical protein